MPKCPNCGQETLRTEDWVCQWCGYPLLSKSYRRIEKTYKQLQEERRRELVAGHLEYETAEETAIETKSEVHPEPVMDSQPEPKLETEAEIEPEPEPEPEAEPETEPEPKLEAEPEPEVAEESNVETEEPEAEVEEESKTEQESEEEPESKPKKKAKSKEKTETEAKAETKSKSKSRRKPKEEPEPVAEVQPEPEPELPEETAVDEEAEPDSGTEPEAEPVLEAPSAPVPVTGAGLEEIDGEIRVSVDVLNSLYKSDKSATHKKLVDKTVRITGVVEKIFIRDHLDIRYIVLKGTEKAAVWNVRCTFNKENSGEMSRLIAGQTTTLLGKYDGYGKNIVIKDCVAAG